MQFKVDGQAFRKLIHELVTMVCLSSKGKDTDLRVTAASDGKLHVEIQDTLGYGYAAMEAEIAEPGEFYASSSIFTSIKVDKRIFEDPAKERARVVREMNDAESAPESEAPKSSEPLWFECKLVETDLEIACRVLNWKHTVHREVEAFNKITVDAPESSLVLEPHLAAQLAHSIKQALPFAPKFNGIGDQLVHMTGMQLRTVTSPEGSIIVVTASNGKSGCVDQVDTGKVLPDISVLPPAAFLGNVFQVCDFSKKEYTLQIDVAANMLAIHTGRHYVVHQNLDQRDYPTISKYIDQWEAGQRFGSVEYPVARSHAYIGSVCTGIKKEVPITFKHGADKQVLMTVDVARRSGKVVFEDATVHEEISRPPQNQVQLYLGKFEKGLEAFAKEGLDTMVMNVYSPCTILAPADPEESKMRVCLGYVGGPGSA